MPAKPTPLNDAGLRIARVSDVLSNRYTCDSAVVPGARDRTELSALVRELRAVAESLSHVEPLPEERYWAPSHVWSPWRPVAAIGWLGFAGIAGLYLLAMSTCASYQRRQLDACAIRWRTTRTAADSVRVATDCGMRTIQRTIQRAVLVP